MDQDPRALAFEALAHLLVSDESLGDALRQVAKVSVGAVATAAYAGITLDDERGRPATPIFTDPDVPEMDQAQFDADRGPCLDAKRQGEVIRIDDLSSDGAEMYPEFAAAAKAHGVQSTLSIPLLSDGVPLAALNLYSREVNGFSLDDEQLVLDLAPATAAFLANAQAYWRAFTLSEQLNEAMSSRAIIEQAKGVLMATTPEIDADRAFDILVSASQRENVKLRDIAQRIVNARPGNTGADH
ncbi:MAG TPA: GAF and ANTAR domain-containing protein [Aquihabitans sp.]|jgi:GAF domain-containing protein|nr:GAF and ANTAR domain-containing protein [Aquihabitans sp.]